MGINKLLFLFVVFGSLSNAKVVDLGKSGHTYDIPEGSMLEFLENGAKELQSTLTKDKLAEIIKSEIKRHSIGYSDLPNIKTVTAYETDNYQIIDKDIRNPAGRLWKKKGEKVLMNTLQPLDLCFVDGKNLTSLLNQIDYLDKVVGQKSSVECTYMVANRSVLFLNDKLYPRVFYPTNKAYEDRFMVKSLPTYIHIEGAKKLVYEFPISMFKHQVKIK